MTEQNQVIRRRLTTVYPMRRTAAEWFRNDGILSEAIQYALESEEAESIALSVESLGGWQYAALGNVATIRQALAASNTETVCRSFDTLQSTNPALALDRSGTHLPDDPCA